VPKAKRVLKSNQGVGVNPLFSPQYPNAEEAREALLHTLHQSPKKFGQSGTRWKLQTLLMACKWLCLKSLAGLWQLLKRLRICWKRARAHVHSPDPHYIEKLSWVKVNFLKTDLETKIFLFQDEFTFYRQPSLAWAYETIGKQQPLAELGWRSNLAWRIAATMNGYTGQVTYLQGYHIGIRQLLQLYQQVVLAYPKATTICIAQDNWPVHYHPDLCVALQPQDWKWAPKLPANWPVEANPKAKHLNLPLQLLPLPTYASWTNPIEKLWRNLRQDVLHLHRFEDDWDSTKQAVTSFLDQFAHGSPDLLRYVGLQNPTKIYHSLPAIQFD
jgi:DDE superfamily endonuclease